MAAGVAALYLSRNPTATAEDVWNHMIESATNGALQKTTLNGSPNIMLKTGDSKKGPKIVAQPDSQTYAVGGPKVQLSVVVQAEGDMNTFSYQWYRGSRGITTNPVSNGTAWSISVGPSVPTLYWARVDTPHGTVDSTAATVNVDNCSVSVSASTNSSIIKDDCKARLTAEPKGSYSGVTYQWYERIGEVDQQISGATGSFYDTPSAAQLGVRTRHHYFVRTSFSTACGSRIFDSTPVTIDANPIDVTPQKPCGDANGNGSMSVADIFFLINYFFAGGPQPFNNADVNGDMTDSVGDLFHMINYLFAGGPAPVCATSCQ